MAATFDPPPKPPRSVAFGQSTGRWSYRPRSRTYDLSVGHDGQAPGKSMVLKTTKGAEETSVIIDPGSTAFVVVDMQNFFLDPSCRDHQTGLAAVKPILEVADMCRKTGIRIIWLNWGLTDDDLKQLPASLVHGFMWKYLDRLSPAVGVGGPADAEAEDGHPITSPTSPPVPAGLGADMGGGKGRALMEGSWNAALYPPLAESVAKAGGGLDSWVAKDRMSGLWSPHTALFTHLSRSGLDEQPGPGSGSRKGQPPGDAKQKKIRTLLFAGVNTDQCVLGTLTDAYSWGWDCILVEDCCATTTPGGQEVTVLNCSAAYGFVVDSKSICEAEMSTLAE